MELNDVAAVAAAAGALAAWVAAWTSKQAVERSHRPFVYAEPELVSDEYGAPEERRWIRSRLRNDGVGVALEVRLRLEAQDGSWAGDPTQPVRAMRAGEVVPPESKQGFEFARPPRDVEKWVSVTRYDDTGGQAWEVRNQRHPAGPLTVRRLRTGRLIVWRPRRHW